MVEEKSYKLVLANGAFKSGSTWLRQIVKCFGAFSAFPEEYSKKRSRYWIRENRIGDFLQDPKQSGIYLSKSHIYLPEMVGMLTRSENVRVLNISRDIKDVVVSAYFHYRRRTGKDLSFERYYWKVGRMKAYEVMQYNRFWSIECPNTLLTSYDGLKDNFFGEVERIARFLEFSLTPEEIAEIQEATSLENLRKKKGEESTNEERRFFRKGISGDWKNHFKEEELADIKEIEDYGLRGANSLVYWIAFPMRRRIAYWVDKAVQITSGR